MELKRPTWLESVLACPGCLRGGLAQQPSDENGESRYACGECHRVYPVDPLGVIDFRVIDRLLALPEPFLGVWTLAQLNALSEYLNRSPNSIAALERPGVREFAAFMDLDGLDVLDVGSGTDYVPGYLQDQKPRHYVALDPLPVGQSVPFDRVRALGEMMPFADDSFDVAIVGTSLDHVICLESFLSEISRVMKRGARAYVWGQFFVTDVFLKNMPERPLFERGCDSPRGIMTPNEYRRLTSEPESLGVDAGGLQERYGEYLVDEYHFRHLPAETLRRAADHNLFLEELQLLSLGIYMDAAMLDLFALLGKDEKRTTSSLDALRQLDQWRMMGYLRQEVHDLRRQLGDSHGTLTRSIAALKFDTETLVLEKRFARESGNCWASALPAAYSQFADSEISQTSLLQLFEDQRPLGPAHALHDSIRTMGGGAYSHWKELLYFSTSDNSDPNTNGRTYWTKVSFAS